MKLDKKQTKIIFWVGISIVGFIIIYILYGIIKAYIKKINDNKVIEDQIVTSDLKHTEAEYNAFAATLFEAMDGFGTNYENIKGVISKLQNASEWNKVKLVFNKNYIDKVDRMYFSTFKGNIDQWLAKEVTKEVYKEEINDLLRKIGGTTL